MNKKSKILTFHLIVLTSEGCSRNDLPRFRDEFSRLTEQVSSACRDIHILINLKEFPVITSGFFAYIGHQAQKPQVKTVGLCAMSGAMQKVARRLALLPGDKAASARFVHPEIEGKVKVFASLENGYETLLSSGERGPSGKRETE